jgi:hypothetical protein
VDKKAAKVGERLKGGTYIPWHTCPSCKRSLLITRFAQHLEKCLGIGGRGARAARVNANAASPLGSRGGTPTPNSRASKNGDEDDDEDEDDKSGGVRKKVLKRGLEKSLKKDVKGVKLGKRPGKTDKRERDELGDDEDNTPLRKRMKMQRVGSTASLQASIGGEESVDGSFVDENDSADD